MPCSTTIKFNYYNCNLGPSPTMCHVGNHTDIATNGEVYTNIATDREIDENLNYTEMTNISIYPVLWVSKLKSLSIFLFCCI